MFSCRGSSLDNGLRAFAQEISVFHFKEVQEFQITTNIFHVRHARSSMISVQINDLSFLCHALDAHGFKLKIIDVSGVIPRKLCQEFQLNETSVFMSIKFNDFCANDFSVLMSKAFWINVFCANTSSAAMSRRIKDSRSKLMISMFSCQRSSNQWFLCKWFQCGYVK